MLFRIGFNVLQGPHHLKKMSHEISKMLEILNNPFMFVYFADVSIKFQINQSLKPEKIQ